MPRGGKRNTNQHQQNQLASVFGATQPPPGLQSSQETESTSESAHLGEYGAPPGLSTGGSSSAQTPPIFYGQPPPGFEQRFSTQSMNPSAPEFHPQSMVGQQSDNISSVPSQVLFTQRPKDPKSKKPKKPKQNGSVQAQEPSNDSEQKQSEPPPSDSKQKNSKNRGGGRQNSHNQPQHQNYRTFNGSTEECVLCVQRSDVFGVGQCKHPACMECVIRMRCLGELKNCHTCRGDIPMMHFVMKPQKWETYQLPSCDAPHPDREKYNICFENQYTVEVYERLNAFTCQVCQRSGEFADFPTFGALKTHVGQKHGLFYCHICQDHLNILPRNRRTFTGKELQLHMTGKKNVVSGVRGHPKCQFCNERYFDEEELYKHSRQKHHFCSICAQELGTNQFFNYADQLLKHYKQKHHPCLHPDCEGVVFSNEFDLNVHKTERHGANDRKIPIDFQFTRGSAYPEASQRVSNQGAGVSLISSNNPPLQSSIPANIIPSAQAGNRPVNIVQRVPATLTERHDFPSLAPSNAPNAYNQGTNWRSSVVATRNQTQQRPAPIPMQHQITSAAHFPTLGSSSSSQQTSASVWSSGKTAEIMKKPAVKPKPKPPSPVRKKIIPLPEVWPENMRRKLEAREQGLPEPEDLDPPLPQPDFNPKKREKKPKKKTVGLDQLRKRLNDQIAALPSSNSKFSALADFE